MRALLKCLSTVIVLLVISCDDEISEIGSNFFEGGSLTMSSVDTISIKVSTIKFDSLVTNDAARLLVGYHEDADLGTISSASFFQIGVDESFSLDKRYTTYSRAELRLVHDGYSYYDTSRSITFNVHELKEAIELPESDPYLYNTSTFKYDAVPMGSVTYRPRPKTKDTVTVSLTGTFGSDIIRLAQSSATEVSSITDFVTYFDGLAIIPANVNGPVVGFASNAQVRVYYIDKSQTPGVERYLSMSVDANTRFNRILSDRGSTKLAALTDVRYAVKSVDTDNKGYYQCGTGLAIRVSIPYLRSILIDNPGLTIVNATLDMPPSRDSEGKNETLPATLTMAQVNYQNKVTNVYETKAALVEDYYLERDTHFTVDVTGFIKQQLAVEEFNDNALVFTPEDAVQRSTVDRMYAGNQFNEREMKLTLTCLTYNK